MRGCLEDSRFKELKEKGTVFEDSEYGRICCIGDRYNLFQVPESSR